MLLLDPPVTHDLPFDILRDFQILLCCQARTKGNTISF